MKKILHTLLPALVFILQSTVAQDNFRRPNIEEMHNRKLQFLTSEAKLTPQETNKLKPVFMAYEKALWDLHQQNRNFYRQAMKESKTKPNYAELNDRYVEYEFKQAQLFKNYHAELKKILSAETLFNYYKAERQFKRKLLENFRERGPMEHPNPQ